MSHITITPSGAPKRKTPPPNPRTPDSTYYNTLRLRRDIPKIVLNITDENGVTTTTKPIDHIKLVDVNDDETDTPYYSTITVEIGDDEHMLNDMLQAEKKSLGGSYWHMTIYFDEGQEEKPIDIWEKYNEETDSYELKFLKDTTWVNIRNYKFIKLEEVDRERENKQILIV